MDYSVSAGVCHTLTGQTAGAIAEKYSKLMNRPANRNTTIRPCTWVWGILVGLTLAVLAVGQAGAEGPVVVFLLLFTTLVKTQMVADYFMGLKQTRLLWRVIVTVYLLIVISMIGLAYWLGMA